MKPAFYGHFIWGKFYIIQDKEKHKINIYPQLSGAQR